MVHKQLDGLQDQIGLIRRELRKVKRLKAKAPKAAPGANFGEKMLGHVLSRVKPKTCGRESIGSTYCAWTWMMLGSTLLC